MTAPTVVILAAGKGSRMRSALPKVLHPLCGRPLVHWPIHAARPLEGHLPEDVVLAVPFGRSWTARTTSCRSCAPPATRSPGTSSRTTS